jgi:hypothetical protein
MAKPSDKEIAARAYKLWKKGNPKDGTKSSDVWLSRSC